MKRDLEFLYEIGTLRYLQRTWEQFLTPEFANITEHTIRVVWLSLIIDRYEGAKDSLKIVLMALGHDVLVESRGSDVNYVKKVYADVHEDMAFKDMLFGTIIAEDLNGFFEEFEAQETLESKIVKDADNLEVNLELKEQQVRGNVLYELWKPLRDSNVYAKLHTETAKKLWQLIDESNPHDWHINAKNRHTAGDWKQENKE